MLPTNALIFTDLDGTLLDHDDYSFDAARPALAEIRARGIPLILSTSKTLAEVIAINRALENRQPVIVENGGALCFPLDLPYPFELTAHEQEQGHAVIRLGPPYAEIRRFIRQVRDEHAWGLRGFGDMRTRDVMQLTGLSEAAARSAMQRQCSEPFLWFGSEAELAALGELVRGQGLDLTRGGRFWHLTGQTSKAAGLKAMRTLFAVDSDTLLTTIALGDSENDREMLQAADIAVVIRRSDGTQLQCHGIRQTLYSERAGPAGWNAAMLQVLARLDG